MLTVVGLAAGLLGAVAGFVAAFSDFALLGALSDFSDLVGFDVFDGLSSLVAALDTAVFVLVGPESVRAGAVLVAGFSGDSATLTGVFSFNSVSDAVAGTASLALSLSTNSGCPGLLRDFIEMPLASCSCASDMLNLPAMRSAFSPGCTV